MEAILPRDMIVEILNKLPNHDLYNYGAASKKSLDASEWIWERRHRVFGRNDDESLPWRTRYSKSFKNLFASNMKQLTEKLTKSKTSKDRKICIENIFNYILSNPLSQKHKKLQPFMKSIQKKMDDYLDGADEEIEVAEKYYPLIFPKEYQEKICWNQFRGLFELRISQVESQDD